MGHTNKYFDLRMFHWCTLWGALYSQISNFLWTHYFYKYRKICGHPIPRSTSICERSTAACMTTTLTRTKLCGHTMLTSTSRWLPRKRHAQKTPRTDSPPRSTATEKRILKEVPAARDIASTRTMPKTVGRCKLDCLQRSSKRVPPRSTATGGIRNVSAAWLPLPV